MERQLLVGLTRQKRKAGSQGQNLILTKRTFPVTCFLRPAFLSGVNAAHKARQWLCAAATTFDGSHGL